MADKQADVALDDLKQGADAVFKQVYEANRGRFLNYASRYDLSDEDTIDLYQDAFVIFYSNIIEGKIERFTSSISTYLFAIGKHLIYDRMKKKKQLNEVNFDLSMVKDDESLTLEMDLEEQALTPEQQLLRTHFSSLGKKCRELLTLFYYRGYKIKDILEMGEYKSENVIKSQKSRCLKTLKERINSSIQ